jgi:hypothetical protein
LGVHIINIIIIIAITITIIIIIIMGVRCILGVLFLRFSVEIFK